MTPPPKIRPDRGAEMDDFLTRIGWAGAARHMLAADASFRRYERVDLAGRIAVLMDAPPPWEDVRPFLHVTRQLTACGASVPTIIAADEAQGFLLLEDLGDASYTRLLKENPARERDLYVAAIDALVEINRASRCINSSPCKGEAGRGTDGTIGPATRSSSLHPNPAPMGDGIPPYNIAVYLREAGLFAEWFLPQVVGIKKAKALRSEWLEIWRGIIDQAQLKQNCLVHRDYHADNLFWLDTRAGHRAVGMLDYQDALWGDAAYDVASLLEDARRDVSPETVAYCLEHFLRRAGENSNDFSRRFHVLAAQRNAKIIGVFLRLCVRDGKQAYAHYLPRVWRHFMHDLQHPLLAPVRAFVDTHVPLSARGAIRADAAIGGIAP